MKYGSGVCLHDHYVDDCTICEAAQAYSRGRADERAAIVAWLKQWPLTDFDHCETDDLQFCISRGDHAHTGGERGGEKPR